MKHRSIALAALCVCAPAAQAQSSVTLYGVMDASVEYVNRVAAAPPTYNAATGTMTPSSTGGARTGMPTLGGLSGSRWGLRGVEDIGNGLKALFVLESGFGPDTGTLQSSGRLFGRSAYVGVSSRDFGTFTIGRQYTTMFDSLASFSPMRLATTYEPVAWALGLNYREDNVIKYVLKAGPLRAATHYSFGVGLSTQGGALPSTATIGGGSGETPGHGSDNTGWGASLTYAADHIGAVVVYDEWRPTITAGQSGRSRKAAAALSYETGLVKLTGGYRWNQSLFGNGVTLVRDDYWWVGANYQATPALGLTLAWYDSNPKAFTPTPTGTTTNPARMQQLSAVADYNLSKRTDIYLSAAWAHNANLCFDAVQSSYTYGYPQMAGQKNMIGVTTGIRHVF